MKFNSLDNWNEGFRHDGMLYFSQRIKEMLFYYTDHVYKVPVLNTYLLIQEYLETATLVRKGIIHESHLKYIMDEFQSSFMSDIILGSKLGDAAQKRILNKINTSSQDEQDKIMTYLLHQLEPYNVWCKEYLRETVPLEREKKKIERALRCFIPGIIGAGYSREFVFFFNRKVFVDSPVTSLDSLDVFLNRFDFALHEYVVYAVIDKSAEKFKEILSSRLDVVFDIEPGMSDLKFDSQKYILIKMTVQALDERCAAKKVYDSLDLFLRYFTFIREKCEEWVGEKAEVKDEEGNSSFVSFVPESFSCRVTSDDATASAFSETIISALLENARTSFPTIDRTISVHNMALASSDLSNSFLNLWSILEIIFIRTKNDSKINVIENSVVPILKKDYGQTILMDTLQDYMRKALGAETLTRIRQEIGLENCDNWFKRFISLDVFSQKRKEVNGLLKDYPLIRTRICQLNEIYSSKENVTAEIQRFSERISWHLKRLYRARNSIIHSGKNISNLKELGEHLHSYVDECMFEIMILLAQDTRIATMDNAIIHIGFQNERMFECLKGKGKFSEEELDAFFSI